jgi:hypothetical protein
MRLTLTLDNTEHWIDLKDVWSRRDLRAWLDLLGTPGAGGDGEQLALLSGWSSACHLVDIDGVVYERVSALSSEALDNLDAAVLRFVFNAPTAAYEQRASLGNARRGGLS